MTDTNPYLPDETLSAQHVKHLVTEALHDWYGRAHKPYFMDGERQLVEVTQEDVTRMQIALRTLIQDNKESIERWLRQ